mmetsp:Transcript_11589/g.34985  ORF Transcript_11589/g.34985 Transcript_11589/m.34985 type:complete len:206 (-) Transcript_11589:84-701(-)
MPDGPPKVFHFKLVVLGDACVGKSSLCTRFTKGELSEHQEPSIGAAFMTRSVNLGRCVVALEIWDTAGQERYRSLAPNYYRGAGAAVVVFDITSRSSFDVAKSWVEELQGTGTMIALAGNKSDLASSRTVEREAVWAYADSMGIIYMETSAKSGQNVDEFFHEVASWLPKQSRGPNEERRAPFRIDPADEIRPGPSADQSWCCSP